MRIPESGDDVRLLNGTFVKVQQYLYTERDIAERTGETVQRRHRVFLTNFKFIFVGTLKSEHLRAWVQVPSDMPETMDGLSYDGVGSRGVSALKIGTDIHQRKELDEEMLNLQRKFEMSKKGRTIGIIMIAAAAGAFVELIILTVLGVIK